MSLYGYLDRARRKDDLRENSENNFPASRFAKDGWLTKTLKSRASTNLNFIPHASLEVICWIKPLVYRFSSF